MAQYGVTEKIMYECCYPVKYILKDEMVEEKIRIWETLNLSAFADSSTEAKRLKTLNG